MRTQRSDTFDLGGGMFQTRSYAGPVNFTVGGEWQPIDTTMTPTADGWRNAAGPYSLAVPSDGSAPVTLTSGANVVSMQLVGAKGAGTAHGDTVTYAGALPSTTLRFTANGDGFKQETVLASAAAPAAQAWALTVSDGLTVTADKLSGGLDISDGKTLVMSVPAPDTSDAAGAVGSSSLALKANADGTFLVTVSVDPVWLADPSRRFPVTVDPSIGLLDTKDCHIVGSPHATTNYCGQALELGFTSANGIRRVMAQFDLTAIPSLDRVVDADLHMQRNTTFSTTSMVIDAKALAYQNWTSAVTWTTYDGTNNWSYAGGTCWYEFSHYNRDCSADSGANISRTFASVTDAGSGNANFDLTRMAQIWVNAPNRNDGVLLKAHSESTTATLRYYGVADGTSLQPALNVTYTVPTGAHGSDSTFDRTLNDRTTLHGNLVSGNLLIQATDVHIAGVGIDFNLGHNYNSKGAAGFYGPAWSGGALDEKLEVITDSQGNNQAVAFTDASGYKSSFLKVDSTGFVTGCATGPDSSSWCPPSGLDATLDNPSAGTWTLLYHSSGEKLTFTVPVGQSTLWMTSDEDRNGNKLTYTRNYSGGNPTTTTIKGSWNASNTLTVTYNTAGGAAGFVDHISDWASRTWSYGYTSGLLTSYTDPDSKVSHYLYDASNNLKEIDTAGTTTLTSLAASGKVQSVQQVISTGPITGPTTTLTIPAPDADGKGTTTLSDPETHNTTYDWRAIGQVDNVTDPDGNTRASTYTDDDQIATVMSAQGGGGTASSAGSFTYASPSNNLQSYTAPSGATSNFTYGTGGAEYQPASNTNALGNTTSNTYDGNGNLTTTKTVASGSGPTWTTKHQTSSTPCTTGLPGQVCSITDAKSNVTSYTYDSVGKATSVTYPSPLGADTIVMDSLYRVSSITDGNGQKRTYIYDPLDRIDKVELNGAATCSPGTGKCVDYTYDGDGNQTAIQDANGTTTISYDPLNRVKNQTQGIDGSKADYTYYDDNALKQVKDTAFTQTYTVNYYYDDANNLTKVNDPGGDIKIGLSTDGHENRSTIDYPTDLVHPVNDVIVNLNPDKGGQAQEIKVTKNAGANTLFDTQYCYFQTTTTGQPQCASGSGITHAGTLRRIVENPSGSAVTTNYLYTPESSVANAAPAGMLCQAYTTTWTSSQTCSTAGLANQYRYDYDPNGNMRQNITPSATTYSASNAANELCVTESTTALPTCATSGTTYTYDSVGNLTGSTPAGWAATLTTDNDRTTKVATTPAGTLSSQQYIGATQDQRVTAGLHNYLNGGTLNGVPSIDADQDTAGTGNTQFFTRTPDGMLLAEHVYTTGAGAGHYYYTLDNIQSIRQIIDSTGTVQANYAYDPYGTTTTTAPPSSVKNPYGYASGYNDKSGLIKYGTRYYSPTLARWTQQDPQTGNTSNPITTNRYLYAGGQPLNQTDPTGKDYGSIFGDVASKIYASGVGALIGYSLGFTIASIFAPEAVVAIAGIGAIFGASLGLSAALAFGYNFLPLPLP